MTSAPYLAPTDLVSDCVDIVMDLAALDADEFLLKAEYVKRIKDLGKRIEAFNAEHMDKGE